MNGVGLDLDDVQGDIVPGFRSDYRELMFVRFPDAAAGREWLRRLYDEVASAREVATFTALREIVHQPRVPPKGRDGVPGERPKRDVALTVRPTWINVALTAEGIEAILGGSARNDGGFPASFADGMVNAGLDYPAEVAAWEVRDRLDEKGDGEAKVAHAVLILGADTERDIDFERSRQVDRLTSLGMDPPVASYRGETLGGGREHFGFRDGISHPDPTDAELLERWVKSDSIIAPGEFILGQPDEDESTTFPGPAWAVNGSYLAFRRLRQFAGTFRETTAAAAKTLSLSATGVGAQAHPGEVDGRFVAAKLFGRWPSGARLVAPADGASPELADPGLQPPDGADRLSITDQHFNDDPLGDGCPLFSHVRRAHPPHRAELLPRRHRILRRAIPYGTELGEREAESGDRGMLFLAYQARLRDGFEHIQRAWFNSGETPEKPGGIGTHGWDPIVGNVPDGDPRSPRRLSYHVRGTSTGDFKPVDFDIQRVVEVTAGGYFFVPSISALWGLSQA